MATQSSRVYAGCRAHRRARASPPRRRPCSPRRRAAARPHRRRRRGEAVRRQRRSPGAAFVAIEGDSSSAWSPSPAAGSSSSPSTRAIAGHRDRAARPRAARRRPDAARRRSPWQLPVARPRPAATRGRAFCAARGFAGCGVVENIRAPLVTTPLRVEPTRRLRAPPRQRDDRAPLLDWIARAFAPVWALEVARAAAGPRRAVHAACTTARRSPSPPPTATTRASAGSARPAPSPRIAASGLGEALLMPLPRSTCAACPKPASSPGSAPRRSTPRPSGAVDDRRFVTLERPDGATMTRAIILAAGFGTRLGALSDERPSRCCRSPTSRSSATPGAPARRTASTRSPSTCTTAAS